MWGKIFDVKTEEGERLANLIMAKVPLTDKEFEEVMPYVGAVALVLLVLIIVGVL
jgi:hypothetical protein